MKSNKQLHFGNGRVRLFPVLLPTEDASPIWFTAHNVLMNTSDGGSIDAVTNQHLSLCSNLPIREGEYGIPECVNELFNNKIIKYVRKHEKIVDWIIVSDGKEEFATTKNVWDNAKKIELITNPKLIADGVPTIDGNTKAYIGYLNSKGENGGGYSVNFLSEFVKRWNEKDKIVCWNCGAEKKVLTGLCSKCGRFHINQKGNQKRVDVEKLADEQLGSGYGNYDLVRASWIAGFKYNQTLQSNAGGFSLEDMVKCFYAGMKHECSKSEYPNCMDYLQSLTKEQSKGDIVIESEMEEMVLVTKDDILDSAKTAPHIFVPKFKDGQPILIFK